MNAQIQSNSVRLTYSPSEVAEMLGLGVATVARRLKDGTLPSTMLGRRRLIPASAIEHLVGAHADRDAA